jgi:hypothetical protein
MIPEGAGGNLAPKQKRKERHMTTIQMQFVSTTTFTRWPCDICGGTTEKVSPLCEGVTPDGRGVRCCEFCLEAGQDKIDAILLRHIEMYEPRLTFLESLVGRLVVPTYAAWEAAVKAENHASELAWDEGRNPPPMHLLKKLDETDPVPF